MQNDLISRSAVDMELQDLIREYNLNCESDKSSGAFESLYRLRLAPAIDPESLRPKGRWERIEDQGSENPVYKCSKCGQEVTADDGTNIEKYVKYCSNCGAKMGE